MKTFKEFINDKYELRVTKSTHHIFIEVFNNNSSIAKATLRTEPEERGVWLTEMYIYPAHRGQHLFSILMKQIDKIYKEIQKPIYLRVWGYEDKPKKDIELINMYSHFGFKQIPNKPVGYMVKNENV